MERRLTGARALATVAALAGCAAGPLAAAAADQLADLQACPLGQRYDACVLQVRYRYNAVRFGVDEAAVLAWGQLPEDERVATARALMDRVEGRLLDWYSTSVSPVIYPGDRMTMPEPDLKDAIEAAAVKLAIDVEPWGNDWKGDFGLVLVPAERLALANAGGPLPLEGHNAYVDQSPQGPLGGVGIGGHRLHTLSAVQASALRRHAAVQSAASASHILR